MILTYVADKTYERSRTKAIPYPQKIKREYMQCHHCRRYFARETGYDGKEYGRALIGFEAGGWRFCSVKCMDSQQSREQNGTPETINFTGASQS